MLKFEFTSGANIEKLITKYNREIPLPQISKLVQEEIIQETKNKGWRRIGKTIKRRTINKDVHEIYLGGNDSNISGYLNRGTKTHYIAPVKKRALSWVGNGIRFFSKGHFVKGIKATNFFRVYPQTFNKIEALLHNFFK